MLLHIGTKVVPLPRNLVFGQVNVIRILLISFLLSFAPVGAQKLVLPAMGKKPAPSILKGQEYTCGTT